MAKYMIQDIVPSGKKKHPTKTPSEITKKTSAPKAEGAQIHSQESEMVMKNTMHEKKEFTQTPPPEPKHDDDDIQDMLPENPRAMILEHLYEEPTRPSESSNLDQKTTTPDEGAWPYNAKSTVPEVNHRTLPHFPSYSEGETKSRGWAPWIIAPLFILILLVVGLNFFAKATVNIIPKSEVITFQEDRQFTASKTPQADTLGYSIMKVTLDDTIEVPATDTKAVTSKASGVIIVYNEQTTSQRLIKNTRFQSPTGKIYRITDSIVVPKATTVSGKLKPGSIEVTIYADEAGPAYNSEPVDFTVPGLKDLPQYSKVYARSKGAIAGGASGTIKSVADEEMRKAADSLRVSLETKLRTKARGDLSPSQVSYEKGMIIDLGEPKLSSTPASQNDRAVVTESGTLYLIVFERSELTKAIMRAMFPGYANESVQLSDLDSLSFNIPEQTGPELWESKVIVFTLGGSPKVVWDVDQDAVKKALLGLPEKNFNLVLGGFSTIERAKATLRPFWKTTYPQEPESIEVHIVDSITE